MEIIMPCAGLSTRFPNLRPKYLLSDYSNQLMIERASANFVGKYSITVVILAEHDKKFNARQKLVDAFGDKIKIVVLDNPTSGPADTAYQAIAQGHVDLSSSIIIKDCDGFYNSDLVEGNAIYVSKLSKNPNIQNAPAKSYTIANEQNIISTVVEKQIVSDSFCVGGYQFNSAAEYKSAFEALRDAATAEIFVSNIIDYMISQGSVFIEKEVSDFVDVGTAKDWFEYNNKPTYFCDIDGTIVMSNDDYYAPYQPIEPNVAELRGELARGCKIVFTTARPKKYEYITRTMLDEMGFAGCDLVMAIHHAKRILINDYANSNPYPSAIAVNLKRDDDNLGDLI
jgi:hypothetical protein